MAKSRIRIPFLTRSIAGYLNTYFSRSLGIPSQVDIDEDDVADACGWRGAHVRVFFPRMGTFQLIAETKDTDFRVSLLTARMRFDSPRPAKAFIEQQVKRLGCFPHSYGKNENGSAWIVEFSMDEITLSSLALLNPATA